MKYEAGGLATIRLTIDVAADLNNGSPAIHSFRASDVVSYTPPEFDWKDARPGMAFREIGKDYHGYFIGFDRDGDPVLDFLHVKDLRACAYQAVPKHLYKPAPEHDIEAVK